MACKHAQLASNAAAAVDVNSRDEVSAERIAPPAAIQKLDTDSKVRADQLFLPLFLPLQLLCLLPLASSALAVLNCLLCSPLGSLLLCLWRKLMASNHLQHGNILLRAFVLLEWRREWNDGHRLHMLEK